MNKKPEYDNMGRYVEPVRVKVAEMAIVIGLAMALAVVVWL